jgi:FkbM family methyltransferase
MDKSDITKIEHEGLTFFVRNTPGYDVTVTDRIVIREIFEENVYQVGNDDVLDGTVVDIGGNVGVFSIYAAALGAKRVLAFEPEDDNAEIFRMNLEANETDNVELNHVAVAGEDKEFEIYKAQGATKRIEFAKNLKVPTQKVKAVSINKIMDELDEVAVLKIDCEGGEYDIFEGITIENLKKIRYITGEFHKASAAAYGKLLAKLSFTHNIHVFGAHDYGGQLYARRY